MGSKSGEFLEFGSERTLPFPGLNEPGLMGLPRLRGLIEGRPWSEVLGEEVRGGFEGPWYPPEDRGEAGVDRWYPPEDRGGAGVDRWYPPEDRGGAGGGWGETGEDRRELPEDRAPGDDPRDPPLDRARPEGRAELPDDLPEDFPEDLLKDFPEDLPEEVLATRDDFLAPPFDFETARETDFDFCRCLPASAVPEGPSNSSSEMAATKSG